MGNKEAVDYAGRDGRVAPDAFFYAEQNARLVKNTEHYYRSMFRGRISSWNLRDRHMAETLEALPGYLRRQGQQAKIVVWAHNSHLGDARATEMGESGELWLIPIESCSRRNTATWWFISAAALRTSAPVFPAEG